MSETRNVEQVRQIFDAFGRGDVPAILERLTEDVDWVIPGPASVIPYAGARKGREGALEFFTRYAESLEMEAFEPREFVAQGDKVVVLGYERFRVRTTGRIAETDWALVFTFRDGQVSRLQSFEDTAALGDGFGTRGG